MSVNVPLMKKKKVNPDLKPAIGGEVNAYDIILGKVQIEIDNIPYYMYINKISPQQIRKPMCQRSEIHRSRNGKTQKRRTEKKRAQS